MATAVAVLNLSRPSKNNFTTHQPHQPLLQDSNSSRITQQTTILQIRAGTPQLHPINTRMSIRSSQHTRYHTRRARWNCFRGWTPWLYRVLWRWSWRGRWVRNLDRGTGIVHVLLGTLQLMVTLRLWNDRRLKSRHQESERICLLLYSPDRPV